MRIRFAAEIQPDPVKSAVIKKKVFRKGEQGKEFGYVGYYNRHLKQRK